MSEPPVAPPPAEATVTRSTARSVTAAWVRASAFALGSLVAGFALSYALALAWSAGALAPRAPRTADAAVVLGAAVWAGGQPSPVLANRARAGGGLFRAGRVAWVVTTGGVGRNAPSEGEVARELIVREGLVPAARAVAEITSRTTFENLANAREALRTRGVRSVFVVSDGYHLARGVRMARDLGFDAWGIAADGSPARSALRHRALWVREGELLLGYCLARSSVR